MKRHIAILLVILALAEARGFAREPLAPPSPSKTASTRVGSIGEGTDGNSLFIGHYGEAIEFPYLWDAEAELRGGMEVVYFHRKSHDDFGYKPFNPTPADYKLENFAPLGLMELVIIPKNAPGGLRSLEAIRQAKEQELKNNGVEYKVFHSMSDLHWPAGTFHIEVIKPYRLVQAYAESSKEFYILTTGGRLNEGDFGLSRDRVQDYYHADNIVSRSVGSHLLRVNKKIIRNSIFEVTTDEFNRLFSSSCPLGLWALCGAFSAVMLMIAIWPRKSGRTTRLQIFGYSLFAFPTLLALLGFLCVYLPFRVGGVAWKHSEDAMIIPTLLIPLMSWLAARRYGSQHVSRVMVWIGGLAALWIGALTLGPRSEFSWPVSDLIFWNTVILHLVGIIFGAVFAAAFGALAHREDKR